MQSNARSRCAEVGARSRTPYAKRLERFELMSAIRHGLPPYARPRSLQHVADELVRLGYDRISRERVRQLLKEGTPKDRRGTATDRLVRRREDLEERIREWAARGSKLGEARAEGYRKELESLGSGTDRP